MRITQWAEYGAHCLAFMAGQEQQGSATTSALQIAESQKIDLLYAQQILQRLRRGGLICSVRGPRGGYKLARRPDEITLRDILLAAEGETFELICKSKPISFDRCAPDRPCYLRNVWHNLQTHVDVYLKQITLATIIMRSADTMAAAIPIHINRQSSPGSPQPVT